MSKRTLSFFALKNEINIQKIITLRLANSYPCKDQKPSKPLKYLKTRTLSLYFFSIISFTFKIHILIQEVDRSSSEASPSSGKGTHLQQLVDKFKHRTALAVRELQQAQQELWALRGATTGQLPTDLEQDFAALKKRVHFKFNFSFILLPFY